MPIGGPMSLCSLKRNVSNFCKCCSFYTAVVGDEISLLLAQNEMRFARNLPRYNSALAAHASGRLLVRSLHSIAVFYSHSFRIAAGSCHEKWTIPRVGHGNVHGPSTFRRAGVSQRHYSASQFETTSRFTIS